MRLPIKPSHTPETTAVFLIFLPNAITVAKTSLAVFSPRTTSKSFMTFAGLKKCMPITSCGRLVKLAILFKSSVDVLLAKIAPAFITPSKDLKTASFTPISSNTASMTKSASFKSVYAKVVLSKAMRCSYLSCLSLPFLTCAS